MKLWTAHHDCFEHAILLEVFDERPIRPDGTPSVLLDVGCCESDLAHVAGTLGWESYGVDIAPYRVGMLAQIKIPLPDTNQEYVLGLVLPGNYFALPPTEFRFLQGDFLTMPLPFLDGSVDVVIANSSIEHFGLTRKTSSEQESQGDMLALERIRRLLRPRGILYWTMPMLLVEKTLSDTRFYSEEGVARRLVDNGFLILAFKGYCFNPAWESEEQVPMRIRHDIARGRLEPYRVFGGNYPESPLANNSAVVKARKI